MIREDVDQHFAQQINDDEDFKNACDRLGKLINMPNETNIVDVIYGAVSRITELELALKKAAGSDEMIDFETEFPKRYSYDVTPGGTDFIQNLAYTDTDGDKS